MAAIRPLNSDLRKIAEKELNEVPGRIVEDLRALKDWIEKQSFLRARTDDQFLVAFLRSCKYSLGEAKEKIDLFYSLRSTASELLTNRDPQDPIVANVIKHGVFLPMPNLTSPGGVRVFLLRLAQHDVKQFGLEDVMKVLYLILELMVHEDDNAVVSGYQIVVDLDNTGISHLGQMTPKLIRNSVQIIQDAIPLKIQGFHYINMASLYEVVLKFFKSCLNEEYQNVTWVHSSMKDLSIEVPINLLPLEYGGDAGPVQEIADFWEKKILSYRDFIVDDAKYGTDERNRPGRKNHNEITFGTDGSFRKLNVD